MRTYLECVSCFVRQALDAARRTTSDPAVHQRVLRQTLRLAAEMPFDRPPPWMGQQIHRLLREATGSDDPYRQAKREANELALRLYPALKQRVRESAEPFETALRLAIAGNVIDLGVKSQLDDDEVHRAIDGALTDTLDTGALGDLRQAVRAAKDILYLADNAGEIVLDRLLIEEMPADRVTVVVKGKPIINDATREDAEAAGLTALVRVIDNGSDVPGTILEMCSAPFRDRFVRCDLVVSKGQGNYETLGGVDGKVFFLLKAKCPVIARDIRCRIGQMVICRDDPNRDPAGSR